MDHRGTNFEVVEVSPYRSRWIIYPKKSLRVGKVVRGIMAQTPREMNPVPAQFLGMNEKGNRYVISALKNKRAALAGEMNQLERQLRHRRECLQHVDACLRLLDPTLAVESIPNKRLPRHINLFRQGELSRLVSDTLREADGKPLRPLEIVAAIMRKNGITNEARNVLRVRVRSNLGYLERRGKVARVGERKDARRHVSASV